MANLVVTVVDSSNKQNVAGAYVQVTLAGHSSQGANVPPAGGTGTADGNGQAAFAIAEAPNGWSGDCWSYSGTGSVTADGYAASPFSVSTGCITGDVDVTVSLNKVVGAASSAGSSASSGQAALTAPVIDYGSYIMPVVIVGALGVGGVVAYRVYKKRRERRRSQGEESDVARLGRYGRRALSFGKALIP